MPSDTTTAAQEYTFFLVTTTEEAGLTNCRPVTDADGNLLKFSNAAAAARLGNIVVQTLSPTDPHTLVLVVSVAEWTPTFRTAPMNALALKIVNYITN